MSMLPEMDDGSLSFRCANSEDVAAIVCLVNSAYRGDSSRAGWTTEADLLGGQRTDAAMVQELMEADDSLILLCFLGSTMVGTAHLQRDGAGAYLGMLTVQPGLQGRGIGSRFLAAAEAQARTAWQAGWISMTVIDIRTELIAYYERRGYRHTGTHKPFPRGVQFGIPKVADLRLAVLEKRL